MGSKNSRFHEDDLLGRLPLDVIPRIFRYLKVGEIVPFMRISRNILRCVNESFRGRKVGDPEVKKLVKRKAPEGLLLSLLKKDCFYGLSELSMYLLFERGVVNKFFRFMKELLNHIKLNEEMFNMAIRYGGVEIVKLFLDDGRIDPANQMNEPARIACETGNLKILKMLCRSSKKVDLSMKNNYCFRTACEKGYCEIVRFLLQRSEINPNENCQFFYHGSFGVAAKKGNLKLCHILVEDGRVYPSGFSNYALKECSVNNHLEVLKFLMSLDRVDPTDGSNYALRHSAMRGHIEIVKQLMTCEAVRDSSEVEEAFIDSSFEKIRVYLGKYASRNEKRERKRKKKAMDKFKRECKRKRMRKRKEKMAEMWKKCRFL